MSINEPKACGEPPICGGVVRVAVIDAYFGVRAQRLEMAVCLAKQLEAAAAESLIEAIKCRKIAIRVA